MRLRSACRGSLTRPLAFVSTIALTLLLTDHAAAAEARSLRFEHLSRESGLSQSFVYTIVQDPQGFMWFGTQEGLNRFDGFEFKVFSHDRDDPASLSDETVRAMIRDRSGTLWIGTDQGGLSRYEPATETFVNYLHDPANPQSIGDNRVRAIFEDRSGTLWIGTDGSGLDRFDRDTGTFTHFRPDPGNPDAISDGHVWDVLEDSEGELWIATADGLNRLDRQSGRFIHYKHEAETPGTLSDNRLRVLFEDSGGTLWIGTEAGGLNRFDRASGGFQRFLHDPGDTSTISSNRVNVIFEDDAGILWIGTNPGLNAYNPDTQSFDRYARIAGDRYSLAHDNVLSLFQDRSGVFWVGTYDGLSKWNPFTRAMLHFRHRPDDPGSLSENTVTAFTQSNDGRIWVGTYGGGLNVLDRAKESFRQYRHLPDDPASISSDRVMALHVDSGGVLWAGTRAAGLNRLDATTGAVRRFRHDPQDSASISADGVTAILEDSGGSLWIATFGGGLNRFDSETETFTRFQHDPTDPESISNDRVLILFEDSAGAIWAGTYGGGLSRLEPETGKFSHVPAAPERPDGLSGNEIYMIQEDARGDLWIAAKGAGLNRWAASDRAAGKQVFQRFTELDGLPSATIYSGVWDTSGFLWMSSAHGLSKLDVDSLEITNYDTSHGLQGDEFNLSAGFRATDGLIMFGGLNGFNAFHPDQLAGNGLPPQVAITSILAMNEPIDLAESRGADAAMILGHDQNMLSFEFAALDYAAPDKNRFMYRLDGLDEDWVDAANQRQVTYMNLPAGDYTFRVRAANNRGVWSTQDATTSLSIRPAPWRTWWAYGIYALALLGIMLAAHKANAGRMERAARLRYLDTLELLQSRLSEAQRISSLGNWDWNIETNELWWSDETYRLFQLDHAAFDANYESFLAMVHPDDREFVDDSVRRALSGESSYAIDHRIVRTDGSERIVHERAEVWFDDAGKPVRMAGTVHDITERKKAENELRQRAIFQELLATQSSDFMQARPYDFDARLQVALEAVGERYGLDVISIWWRGENRDSLRAAHRWSRDGAAATRVRAGRSEFPWMAEQLLDGEVIAIDDVLHLPMPATTDQGSLRERDTRSILVVPLCAGDDLSGACMFLTKYERRDWLPDTIAELKIIAENLAGAIARARAQVEIEQLKDQLQAENLYLREEVRLAHGFDEIIGEDRALKKSLQAVEKVAPTDIAVLILGETGTGKELIARAVHKLSHRRDKPMVSVNCPALPANLIESELFGHEKGAFTGADSSRRGRFELADGGTLFLDEIGELPLELQSKLLRVLQTGEFERLGGTKTLRVDVRLIAATNRNLSAAIDRGEFRSDLFYRIASFPIQLPPLRDREGDIPLLAEHFVHKHAGQLGKQIEAISAQMIRELLNYDWPGNIRELESVIERSLISAESDSVLELPGPLRLVARFDQTKADLAADTTSELVEVERAHIVSVLEQSDWKVSGSGGAASMLGIPPSTLRSKMKKLGISRDKG